MEKVYYSIAEVAKMFEVNHSLLRFWEDEFEQLEPKQNTKSIPLFCCFVAANNSKFAENFFAPSSYTSYTSCPADRWNKLAHSRITWLSKQNILTWSYFWVLRTGPTFGTPLTSSCGLPRTVSAFNTQQ